jgi:nucleoside-diphosphate-sugar epimerase
MSTPILVTGANGFVGSHVVEELLQHGYSVRCLLRTHSQPNWIETLPVDIQRVDYFDPNALRKAVSGSEAILHFGGATKAKDKEAFFHANTRTTKALLSAAADACPDLTLFLFCSSQAALGPSPSLDPLDESAPVQPISDYGWSKMAAEKLCREYEERFPIVILRPPAVYGPRDKDILIFFKTIRWGISPTIGRGERYISLVHAGDIAQISRLILHKPQRGMRIYHVTDGDVHRWSQVLDAIAEAMDKRPIHIAVPTGLAVFISRVVSGFASAAGRLSTMNREKLNEVLQNYWLISSRRAEEELGYRPKFKLEEGITDTVRWYREHRWL